MPATDVVLREEDCKLYDWGVEQGYLHETGVAQAQVGEIEIEIEGIGGQEVAHVANQESE